MVAMAFNAQMYTPTYGGGGNNLPPGKYKGVIVDTSAEQSTKGGGFLKFTLTPIEGPLAGQKHDDRLNLHHTNPQTVEIANKQLSAYCHVLGKYQFNDTQELVNIPFCFEVGYQKGEEPSEAKPNGGYTEVKAIFDINGNAPGKAGAGPAAQPQQAQPPAQPPAGVAPTGAAPGWGAPAAQPTAQPAPNGGQAWGAPAQQAAQPAAQPNTGPWGAPAGATGTPPAWGQPPA